MATEEVDLLGGPDDIPQTEYVEIGSDRYRTITMYLPSLIASKKLELHWKRLSGLSTEIRVLNEILNTPPITYSEILNEFSQIPNDSDSFMEIENMFQRTEIMFQIKGILRELVQVVNIYKTKQAQPKNSQATYPARCELFCDISYAQIMSLFVSGFLCAARHCHELSGSLAFNFLFPALLEVPDVGTEIVFHVAINRPECFNDIIASLIRNSDDNIKSGRISALYKLAKLSKYAASSIREECVASQVLPEVIFRVTLEIFHDEIPFITSLASSQSCDNDEFISLYFASVPEPKEADELRSALWNKINTTKDDKVTLCEALRGLCAAHCRFGVPIIDLEEKTFISNLIRGTSDVDVHKLLFACLYSWRNVHKETIGHCIKELSAAGRIPQLFLLAAILIHTDKSAQLHEYMKKILDFSLSPGTSLGRNPQVFEQVLTKEILPLEACCGRALKLPHVTEDTPSAVVDATFRSFLVLLEHNFFAKYRVDAGSWLVPQILSGGLPARPLFIETISSYAVAAARQYMREEQGQDQYKWGPTIISEEEARRVLGMPHVPMRKYQGLIPLPLSCGFSQLKFSSRATQDAKPVKESNMYGAGARYFVTLFVLEYSEAWAEQKAGTGSVYLDDFLWNIPVREILSDARLDPRCAGALTTRLAALGMSQFPHLVDPELLLIRSIGNTRIGQEDPEPAGGKWMEKPLSGDESEEELEVYTTKWLERFAQDPWNLSLDFVNSGAGRTMPKVLTHADIITDLTTVLRAVDRKALRSPNLIRIILSVLKMYRSVARKTLSEQEALQPQRTEEIQTFVTAQDTALIQLLLEVCLENNPALPPASGLTELAAVRALICDFVHHLFIEDPILITIVHTQGYNLDLVPVTAHGIPSVYLCQDFLPTLLARPDVVDKIFAVTLGVALAQEYKTEQLYKVMGLVIDSIHNFHRASFKGDPAQFLAGSIPLLLPLVRAFPCYEEKVLSVLSDLLDTTTADAYTNMNLITVIKKTTNEINTH